MFETTRTLPKRLEQSAPRREATEGRVTGGDSLRENKNVRLDTEVLHSEPCAETPEAGDHLVSDQQDAVAVADLPDSAEVVRRRHKCSRRCPHDRFSDESGDSLRAHLEESPFQFPRTGKRAFPERTTMATSSVPVRCFNMGKGQQQRSVPLATCGVPPS